MKNFFKQMRISALDTRRLRSENTCYRHEREKKKLSDSGHASLEEAMEKGDAHMRKRKMGKSLLSFVHSAIY